MSRGRNYQRGTSVPVTPAHNSCLTVDMAPGSCTLWYKKKASYAESMETSFSQLRVNLRGFCQKAVTNREPIRVRRKEGEDVVLLAADEYDALVETAHLLSSPRNAARLLESLARARKGKIKPMTKITRSRKGDPS